MSRQPDPNDRETQDRNWSELLQELRVTQTGVQLLSGFLLTVPFSTRFPELDGLQRAAYVVVFTGSILATALLIAPVAFHRVLFRRRRRRWLVEAANICARAGLATLALTVCGILFLVFDLVVARAAAWTALGVAAAAFALLWWGLPWATDRFDDREDDPADPALGKNAT
jgi:hypothetical protein